MNKRDSLGDRMKANYENVSRTYLTRRTPVIIRLDGKSFHTFTRGFNRPFDALLANTMQSTMKYLCENIQGCVLGYTQSDEITLVLCDYQNINTSAWFDYNVQKMCSVAASMATMAFNCFFKEEMDEFKNENYVILGSGQHEGWFSSHCAELWNAYEKAYTRGAMFDARCFNIPKEEVCNCLIWRQQDATRNSIQMVGQYYFPHATLQRKSNKELQDMLMLEKGINWNDYSSIFKRGSCCKKEIYYAENIILSMNGNPPKIETTARSRWVVDTEIPIFTQDRNYIEECINF